MFINITLEVDDRTSDIRIDSEQKINMGLIILRESGKMPPGAMPAYFRSKQSEKLVSAYKTFQDESIYDGDILTAITTKH